jgi:O-antigen ligase
MHIGFGLGLEDVLRYPLYIGAAVAFVLSVFWKPQIGLYYLIPLLPLQTVRYRLNGLFLGEKLTDILLLGVTLGLLLQGKLSWKTPLTKLLLFSGLFYFLLLCRGSIYLGIPLPLSIADPRFSAWKNFMVMPVLFFTVASAIKNAKSMKILLLLMALSTLMVNRSFYNTVSGRDFSHFSYDLREAGALGYAGENGFGAFEAMAAVWLLVFYSGSKKWLVKAGLAGLFLTTLYCLAFSFSRGAYFGFLAGVTFLGIFKNRKLLVLLVIFLTSWQLFVPPAVKERVLMTKQADGQYESSAEARILLWDDAVKLMKENFLMGTGFDTYEYMHRVGPYTDTHNLYLKFVVETGIIGLLLLLWLFAKTWLLGYRLFRSASDSFWSSLGLALAASMVCGVVLNFFGDRWTYIQVTGFFWTLMAFVVQGLAVGTQPSPDSVDPEAEASVPSPAPLDLVSA